MVRSAFAAALFALAYLSNAGAARGGEQVRPLSIAAAIQTARLQGGASDADPYVISPDGQHYVTMLVSGDLARNGVTARLLVGELATLAAAAHPKALVSLFSHARYDGVHIMHIAFVMPGWAPLFWLDNSHVGYFWEDGQGIVQAYSVDIQTGAVVPLTEASQDLNVFALSVSAQGDVLYSAFAAFSTTRSQKLLMDGFTVTSADAFSLVDGYVDGSSDLERFWSTDWFLRRKGRAPVRLQSGNVPVPSWPFTARFSPDGAKAVLELAAPTVPRTWLGYTDTWVHQMVSDWLDVSPNSFSARQLHQYFLLDVATGSLRPLTNAPMIDAQLRSIAWSPDGRSIAIAPALEPIEHGTAPGLKGRVAIVVDARSRDWVALPGDFDPNAVKHDGVTWLSSDTLTIALKTKTLAFKRTAGRWTAVAAPVGTARVDVVLSMTGDLNTPPKLMARDTKTGQSVVAINPNPDLLTRYALGHVEQVNWRGPDGHVWKSPLYFPVNYEKGRRYPLVVQTHGYDALNGFSLYGNGPPLGPGFGPFAARTLSGRGFFVLQVEDRSDLPMAKEADGFLHGIEDGVHQLVNQGLVDGARVGLEGFSRTGWYVEYIITHSNYPYAAALAADNISGSYVESTLAEPGTMEVENGGAPFGPVLQSWLREAPGFNAEHVHTPLLLQLYSGPISMAISHWETFSRLRRLNKPVEYDVLPDINHGGHNLQNPRQVLAIKQQAVDWFDYWLNGAEQKNPQARPQNDRWEKLCALQRRDRPQQPSLCVSASHP